MGAPCGRSPRRPRFSLGTALGRLGPSALAGVDVAHFPYYVRPYALRVPSVTTVHDTIPLLFPEMIPSARARWLTRWMNALAVRASTRVIAVSRSSADDIARLFPAGRGKIDVVQEAADAMFVPQPARAIARVRASFALPERFALYLASNKPHKNLVRLVEAWKRLIDRQPGSPVVPLVIAGHHDPRFPDAQARAGALGLGDAVRFIGDVPNADLPALYSACALFVFPSLYEGFGLTPLEAMACGAPVACSNTSSLPEVAGDAALLFYPASSEAIAETCARALADPDLLRELSARSMRRAAAFSWDKAASDTIAVYRSVANT